MYQKHEQLSIDDFIFPLGQLNTENEWVILAENIPWDKIEDIYARQFVNNGHPAHPARMAFGALIIKQTLNCSDEWTVRHISENPYLQFFIGLKEYQSRCPFGASTMVAFRKRFTEEDMAIINEMIIQASIEPTDKNEQTKDDNDNGTTADNNNVPSEQQISEHNQGELILDATCVPANIRYPQDLSLLNEARQNLEALMDTLHEQSGKQTKKPRNYRKTALKAYQSVSKRRRKSGKLLRKAIRKQLGYIKRDIEIINTYLSKGAHLNDRQNKRYTTILTLYAQQSEMYQNRKHSVAQRIVSIKQDYIRPIVRGKIKSPTEFGAKLHMSLSEGYCRIERIDFNAYNEAEDLPKAAESYRQRTGHYPERILADKIYRNRNNLRYCKEHNIALTGPRLGRPPKHYQEDKKQAYKDLCERNTIEGRFGTAKQNYGLNKIKANLKETSIIVIYMSIILLNLRKKLKAFFVPFYTLIYYFPSLALICSYVA